MSMGNDLQDEGIHDINITPFVDVVLVLLVIFMVTAPMMVKQALDIKLPSSKTADALEKSTLGVAITAAGQILLNGSLMTPESFLNAVKEVASRDRKVQAIIAADLDSRHEAVVKVMDLLRQAGVTHFAFQVARQDD